MNETRKEATIKYFEDRAKEWVDDAYDSSAGLIPIGEQRIDRVRSILGSYIKRENPGDFSICDLGCGDGSLCMKLAAQGYRVTGVDRSRSMISLATEKNPHPDENLAFIHSDIEDVAKAVNGKRFDIVTSLGVMYYLDDDTFFSAARSILSQSGMMIISCRNRLFNVFAGSSKRYAELEGGSLAKIITELFSIDTSIKLPELLQVVEKLRDILMVIKDKDIPRSEHSANSEKLKEVLHKIEGRQHTPEEIKSTAKRYGLKLENLYGIQPHFFSANAHDQDANIILKKLSEALLPLAHLPISLIWSSHFIAEFHAID